MSRWHREHPDATREDEIGAIEWAALMERIRAEAEQ